MSDLVDRLRWWGAKQKPPRGMDTLPADCREAATRISQQDAELERLRREVEALRDAKWQAKHVDTMNDIASLRIALEGAEAALVEAEKKFETADKLRVFWNDKATELAGKLAETRKAAFIEAAEMASLSSSPSVYAFAAMIRAKTEETGR